MGTGQSQLMADENAAVVPDTAAKAANQSVATLAPASMPGSAIVNVKDVLTISLSIAAFVLSMFTAYSTLLRTVDDVRVALGEQSPVAIFHKSEGLEGTVRVADVTYELILMNAGTRSVAVTDVGFSLAQSWSASSPAQCGGGWPVSYRPTRLILKPGEILSHNLALSESQVLKVDNDFLRVPLESRVNAPVSIVGCLQITIGTPNEMKRVTEPVWKAVYEPHASDNEIPKLLSSRPIIGPEGVVQLYKRQCLTPLC